MAYTWGQLKTDARLAIWPAGEAPNLVTQHNTAFINGICDLQQFVPCLQQDNTDVVPACSTYYKCGITMFQAPRGFIKKVSVVSAVSPSVSMDYCGEIEYRQIGPEYMQAWIRRYAHAYSNCFCDFAAFFSLDPSLCRKVVIPIPTDAGLAAGLSPLPLGVHYAQGSTDRYRRSLAGVWAIERGVIYLAPWINVTTNPENVIVVWDGIKRTWSDEDPVDNDPLLGEALEEFVRSDHARKYDRDMEVAQTAGEAFTNARVKLIHACRMENVVRFPEASYARNSASTLAGSVLYYNDREFTEAATADTSDCPAGQNAQENTSASYTVPSGSVSSPVSIADANAKAQALAQQQAKALAIAKLVCASQDTGGGTGGGTTGGVWKNRKVSVTVECQTSDVNAPAPTGNSVTIEVAEGRFSSTVSQDAADGIARAWGTNQANAALRCTYHNSAQTQTAKCSLDPLITDTETIAAGTAAYDSTLSQDDANQKAKDAAMNLAVAAVQALPACSGGGLVTNDEQTGFSRQIRSGCVSTVTVIVPAGLFPGADKNAANLAAIRAGNAHAVAIAIRRASLAQCGDYTATYPGL